MKSRVEMKRKYNLRNNLVIRHVSSKKVSNSRNRCDYNRHKKVLEGLCGGDRKEFSNAIICLRDKMGLRAR